MTTVETPTVTPEAFTRSVQAGTRTAETALTQELADAYAVALRSVAGDCARRFTRQATSLTAAVGDEQADPKFVAPDPMELVPTAKLAAEIEKRTRAIREQIVAVTVGNAFATAGVSFDVGGVFSERILDQVGARIRDADKSTRDAIRTVIGRAQSEGWTVPETAAAIKEHIVELSDSTATQLARTDLIGTSNASADTAAKMVLPADGTVKTWKSAGDHLVRPEHQEADGQTVPLHAPFIVGGEALQFPGDPHGSDSTVINCRCVSLYRSEQDLTASVWRSLVASMQPPLTAAALSAWMEAQYGQPLTAAYSPAQPRMERGVREGGRWRDAQHVAESQPHVEMGVSEFPDALLLHRIVSEVPGQGNASRALDALSEYADASGKPVFLTPQQMGDGLSSRELAGWYARHGFRWDAGKMVRQPGGIH